jgi:hypothetical protein
LLTKLSIAHRKIKENAFSKIFIEIFFSRLLTQQTLITVYRLPTKEEKLPFPDCRKQTVVCLFCFPFASNKRKLPLLLVSFSVYK